MPDDYGTAGLANAIATPAARQSCRWLEGTYLGPCVCDGNLSRVRLADGSEVQHVGRVGTSEELSVGNAVLMLQTTPQGRVLIVGPLKGDIRQAFGCESEV